MQNQIELCPRERAAVKAKVDQIRGLLGEVTTLQEQLQHATPQEKSGIAAEITATNIEKARAEAELPALEAALKACLPKNFGTVAPLGSPTTLR
jgi:hypothetical protein